MSDGNSATDAATPTVAQREWTVRRIAGVYLRGLCMGAADAVPGVSGGTIALITGIYERLIAALTAITPERIARVLGGARPGGRDHARDALLEMDVGFLTALGLGVVSAVVAVTGVVEVAITHYPVPTFGFFFGLIAASAVVLAVDVSLSTPHQIGAGAAGFLLAFLVSGQATNGLGHELPVVFMAGAIAVSAMILPGISGSLLLLLLGQYTYMTETISSLRRRLVDVVSGGDPVSLFGPATVSLAFVAGAVVGLFTVAHAVRWALDRHRQATLAFLVSLIVGALRAPVLEVGRELPAQGLTWADALPEYLGAAVVGAVLVVILDRFAGAIEY